MGALLLPSERFARFGNPARPGIRTAHFAALGAWSGALPKNTESLRNSDALMRVAAPLGCAALTVEFLAFLLLLKTTIANSLTPWYYGVTKSESIG